MYRYIDVYTHIHINGSVFQKNPNIISKLIIIINIISKLIIIMAMATNSYDHLLCSRLHAQYMTCIIS